MKTEEIDTTAGFHNIYLNIHKALRAFMGETLVAGGCLDADDGDDVAVVLEQVRVLRAILTTYLEDEDRFLHAALEARQHRARSCPARVRAAAADRCGWRWPRSGASGSDAATVPAADCSNRYLVGTKMSIQSAEPIGAAKKVTVELASSYRCACRKSYG
jgi:hypothetical protein